VDWAWRIMQFLVLRNYIIFNTVEWFIHILVTIVSYFQRDHPEDSHMTGRNMLATIIQWKYTNKIKVNLLVFNLLKTKRRQFYLKIQFVPCSKHFSSRL
jgi:hypothetical protein